MSMVFCYEIFFEKAIVTKITSKRRQKIFELLKNKYEGLKENDLGFFEYSISNKTLLFEYILTEGRNRLNILKVYLDISTIEEDIKQLCKIHFYCKKIDNRDWVEMPVEVFFDTLNNLVKNSSKTVSNIIAETESYISEKRVERDKNKR
ncbi:hypothetical protein [Flavobacterium daemonense]|uniref:hypothetical protein n=1 Tax=Flavobacterium daemonense TaxID=1393049 RepID=UPI0011870BB4|nr:hypothetical protein [Flavobacterium daemonense]KAF2331943.1 hypothetical protein FND99_12965 [Flavobacterium daemonense]